MIIYVLFVSLFIYWRSFFPSQDEQEQQDDY